MDSSGRIREKKKLGAFQTMVNRDSSKFGKSRNSPTRSLVQIPDVSSRFEGDETGEISPIKGPIGNQLSRFFCNKSENEFLGPRNINNMSLDASNNTKSKDNHPRRESLHLTPRVKN